MDYNLESSETFLPLSKINGVTINKDEPSCLYIYASFFGGIISLLFFMISESAYSIFLLIFFLIYIVFCCFLRQTWLTVFSEHKNYFIFFKKSEIIQYRQFAQTLLAKIE